MADKESVKKPDAKTGKPADTAAETAAAAMGPLLTPVVRHQFYRDGFRVLVKVALVEAVIIAAILVAFISYISISRSNDRYFATTEDGRIIALVPLEKPNMEPRALVEWAAHASADIMTFNYQDYQKRLQYSSRYFTKAGWDMFATNLQKSRIIDALEASQQVVTAQVEGAPRILKQELFNGRYRWTVLMPLAVKYQSSSGARTDNLPVMLVIDRVPSLENPDGVGIEQWTIAAGKS